MSFIECGEGPPLVLLHGIGGNAASFEAQLDAYSDRFRCLAWNMPGYGGEPLDGVPTFAGLAARLLEELAGTGVENAHFLGHSMGGMLVQEIAASRPEAVRSMVLVATSPAFGKPDGAFQKRYLAERLAPLDAGIRLADLATVLVTTMVSTHAEPEGVRCALAAMRAVPEPTWRAMLECLVTFDRRSALASYDCPVMLLAGEADRIAPPLMMERMAARIPSAGFAVVRRAGHFPHLEQARAFDGLVSAFWAEHEDRA